MEINTLIKDRFDALGFFQLMGIEDVTTARQKKNGTTVYELPIKWMNSRGDGYAIKYATYESGYVRNVSPCNSSPWQINKRYETKEKFWNSYYKKYFSSKQYKRILINDEEDRLVYLANYILKNNYGKGGLYAMDEWTRECISENHRDLCHSDNILIAKSEYDKLKRTQWEKDNSVFDSWGTPLDGNDNVQVIINGHRYNLS